MFQFMAAVTLPLRQFSLAVEARVRGSLAQCIHRLTRSCSARRTLVQHPPLLAAGVPVFLGAVPVATIQLRKFAMFTIQSGSTGASDPWVPSALIQYRPSPSSFMSFSSPPSTRAMPSSLSARSRFALLRS